MSKPFTPTAYKKHDPQARRALEYSPLLRRFLREQFGVWDFQENPDKYGIDFFGESLFGPNFDIEVETKNDKHWRHGVFGFSTVHVAGRKKWIFEKAEDLIVQFDEIYEFAAVIDTRNTTWWTIEKPNKSMGGELEEFCAVSEGDVFIVKVRPEVPGRLVRPRFQPPPPVGDLTF